MDGKTYLDFMKIVLICILWYLCSTSDNILGKVVLSDFPYPMTVTMVHLTTAAVCLGPIKRVMGVPRGAALEKRTIYMYIIPLAIGKFVSSVSSYISIWKVSVSYAHTVKATLPMFTVLLSRILLGEKQTFTVYISLFPIIAGVVIATATELSFDRIGLASSVFATICFSLQTIFTKKCLKETMYHHIELLTYVTRIACLCVMPLWFLYDFRRIIKDETFMNGGNSMTTVFMLFLAGLFNTMHNIFAFTVLAMVTPLSYAVANATKRIVIIGGSLIILQNPVSPMNIVGMLVAIFGVLTYNKAKYDQNRAIRLKEVLPYVHSTSDLPNLSHPVGVHHLPHSKSDANFLSNGHIYQDHETRNNNQGNGHLLLQNWQNAPSENFTLMPPTEQSRSDRQSGVLRSNSNKKVNHSSSNLHSRSVFHI